MSKQSKKIRLQEVANIIRGVTFSPSDKVDASEVDSVVCLRTANIQDKTDWQNLIWIKGSVVRDDNRFLKIGDIIISTANSSELVGKCSFIDRLPYKSTLGGFISAIRPSAVLVSPQFLYWFLSQNSIKAFLRNISRKTTNIANLSIPDLLELNIPLPPLHIQKQIADILEAADRARQKREEADKLTEEFLQSAFIDMFGDPVTNPKGWEKRRLMDIAILERDSIESSKISVTDIYIGLDQIEKETGRINRFSEIENSELKSNKFRFSKNHILYGKLRPYLNKVALPDFNGVCSTDILPILPLSGVTNKYYLAYAMRQRNFVQEANAKSTGANLPRLSPKLLEEFIFIVPNISLQTQFADLVQKTEALKAKQAQSKKELDELFNSLMQKAFSGELVS